MSDSLSPDEIVRDIPLNGVTSVTMHDGSLIRFTRVPDRYDPTDRRKVRLPDAATGRAGEVVTGLLYVNDSAADLHELNNTTTTPLTRVPFERLCPGAEALAKLQNEFR